MVSFRLKQVSFPILGFLRMVFQKETANSRISVHAEPKNAVASRIAVLNEAQNAVNPGFFVC